MSDTEEVKKVFWGEVITVQADTSRVVDARGLAKINIIAGTGATVTWSRVDSDTASSHNTGTQNGGVVASDTASVLDVDWPYYLISSADAASRVAVV